MKIEKLRNKGFIKWFLCGLILVVVLTITYMVSKANYRISNSIELTTGKVISGSYDFKLMAIFINNGDGTYIKQEDNMAIPNEGYVLSEENSYCCKKGQSLCTKETSDKDITLFTNIFGGYEFKNIKQASKCYLYFDKNINAKQYILANKTIAERKSISKDFNLSYVEENNNIYIAEDNDGLTYYYAGNVKNNWVWFGGYYWRIIRINGDGSIRMIYQGTEPNEIGENTQIGISTFNNDYNDNAYVGFMYGMSNSSTYEETNTNTNKSNILEYLDNWFQNESGLIEEQLFSKIDLNAGFCGDRQPSSDRFIIDGKGGTGITTSYIGSYSRILPGGTSVNYNTPTVKPTFKCAYERDLYTFKGNDKYLASSKGNKVLENPVGLISADEVSFAGMVFNKAVLAKNNYLFTGQSYWTISPLSFETVKNLSYGAVFYVNLDGYMGYYATSRLDNNYGVRPVINLRSDVTLTGDGTSSNPFNVS